MLPVPPGLPAAVHGVWETACADIGGRLRESDVPQLLAYVEAVWVHSQASAEIHGDGLLVSGASGALTAHPLLKVQKDAAASMLRLADALGLTPAARIRMAVGEVTGLSVLAGLNQQLDQQLRRPA